MSLNMTGKMSKKAKVAVLNLANAQFDEQSPNHRFSQRFDNIVNVIKHENLDVFCALELRICRNLEKTRMMQPEEIANDLAEKTGLKLAVIRPNNLDTMSFRRATFYNPSTLTPITSFDNYAIWPVNNSKIVKERGVMILFTLFQTNEPTDVNYFWIINIHYPLGLEEKMESNKWLNENVRNVCRNAEKELSTSINFPFDENVNIVVFAGGDMNTFFDTEGTQQLDLLKEKWTMVSDESLPTFTSFPHDKFQGTSTLDHIAVLSDSMKVNYGNYKSTRYENASDHYLLTFEINLNHVE